jgi:tRNA wybutosine-synthesizing protein 3
LTASTVCAQRVLTAALSAGFRESGAVSLSVTKSGESTPMVAIRSTGYSFDSIIGYHDENSHNILLVDEKYLRTLVAIANDRFRINVERIARFQSALKDIFSSTAPLNGRSNRPGWEDADTRRQRKREEGLARQQALHTSGSRPADTAQDVQMDAESIDGMFETR